jgi:prepilin-type N-terminal cleavage/methylation domain-containing protein
MNKTNSGEKRAGRQAFTLIELMVVVVVISILMGGVFKLLSATSQVNKTAETKARMERLENAISGYYAENGSYPPVILHGCPDPLKKGNKDDFDDSLPWGTNAEKARAAVWAAKCQPLAFEYPYPVEVDKYIAQNFSYANAVGVNTALGGSADQETESDWQKIKIFKFGLLSYLLPRVETIGVVQESGAAWSATDDPDQKFFLSEQWKSDNKTSRSKNIIEALKTQRAVENRACARWLPNLENQLHGGPGVVLGVATKIPDTIQFRVSAGEYDHTDEEGKIYSAKENGGTKTVLLRATVMDGWGQEFFYHSDPPYQSYRIWSAGKDKNTFPPWIPLSNLGSDRDLVAGWIKDDIVGGSDNK